MSLTLHTGFCRPMSLTLHTGFCRPMSLTLHTGFCRPMSPIRAPYGLWASPISLSLNTATRLPCYVLTFVARIRTAIWGGIDQSGGPGGGPNSVSLFCTSTFFDSPLIRSLRPVTGEEMSVVTTRSPVASPSVT